MPRRLRLGLIVVSGIAALTVAAVSLLAATFDPNTQKQRIIEAVHRATGRDLTLDGPLRLSLRFTPELTAENASLSNAADGTRPAMVTAARMAATVRLLPLLWGHVSVATLALDQPDILIETDAAGRGNWQFQRPQASPAAPPSAPASLAHARATADLDRVTVTEGRLTWHDGETGRIVTVVVPHADISLADDPVRLVADLQIDGQPLHASMTLRPHESGPSQVTLVADGAAGFHLALDGTLAQPPSARSYRGRLDAQIADLSVIAAPLGLPPLPALHDVRVGMMVGEGPQFTPLDMSFHVGHSDLTAQRPGAMLTQLDMALPALGQPGRVTADGTFQGGALHFASGITITPASLVLTGLEITAPGTKLGGNVALRHDQRWALKGDLSAASFDAGWLAAALEPLPATAPPQAAPPAAPRPGKPSQIFSDTKLPWGALQAADADLTLAAATLHVRGTEYRNLSAHFAMAAGSVHVDRFALQTPAGEVAASATLDATPPEPTAKLQAHAAALALGALLQAAGLPGSSNSPIEVDAGFSSSGLSPHDLAAHLDGHAGLAMVDGTVPNAAIAALLGGLIPPGAGHLDLGGRSTVRCLALRLDATAGQVKLAALKLDTQRLDLEGGGTINLDDETLALRLHPTMRFGPTNVGAPVRIDGSLRRPVTILDDTGAGGRSGIVIGGAAPADDCAAELTLARNGAPGPMPAAAKPPKAADLLRSLLR